MPKLQTDKPDIPPALWALLDGRLWHATGPDELRGILSDGRIRVLGHRYLNSLSKSLGAVSLFDFGPTATKVSSQCQNWAGWLGHQQKARVAVWLEIDRAAVAEQLNDAAATLQIWKSQLSKQLIPGVEACYPGDLDVGHVVSVLLIDRHDPNRFWRPEWTLGEIGEEIARFEQSLPPPENYLARATRLAARRTTHPLE